MLKHEQSSCTYHDENAFEQKRKNIYNDDSNTDIKMNYSIKDNDDGNTDIKINNYTQVEGNSYKRHKKGKSTDTKNCVTS